jgi:hypothetical protein
MGWTRLALAGAFVLGTVPAQADMWSMNGASCTPGDPAIQADRYFITAGSVNYRPGASGLVTLYCPINTSSIVAWDPTIQWFLASPWCPGRYRLRLTYTDSDGPGSAVSVTARLLQLSKEKGTFLGTLAGAQIDSNALNVTVPTSQGVSFEHIFDWGAAYRYVRVDMNRAAGTSHFATFYGVALECD